ncbi:hypothetical protein NDU88_003310 [Pleurodeles waltl]|uniref:Uncharacterized protein n=1 Tax=Pleurodeles waltl TaxID=8319 RepID=A0AAV7LIA1_PLEWA|nr:hypothetical protein NDU88_003310 [Pleurodeles waltl]
MGRAMRLPAVPAIALVNITDDMVLDYCKGLADVVRSFSHQAEATTLPLIQGPGHALKTGTETDRREPESEQEEIGTEEIFAEEDEVVPFEENREEASGGDKDPISSEKAGEPDKRRAFPEADDTGKGVEDMTDLPCEGDKTEQSEIVPNLSEPVAGPSGENNAKQRQSISPLKSKTKETLNENEGPNLKEKRKEVSFITTLNEEKDTAKEQDISERESKGDAKLKRKRIPSRRHFGPEWAYTATNDWSDEFLSLSLENEEAEQHFGT